MKRKRKRNMSYSCFCSTHFAYISEVVHEALDECIGKLSSKETADGDHLLALANDRTDDGAHRHNGAQVRGELRTLVHAGHLENLHNILDVLFVRVKSPNDLLESDGQRFHLHEFVQVTLAILDLVQQLIVLANLLTVGCHHVGHTAQVFGHHL